MKHLTIGHNVKALLAFLVLCFIQTIVWAQDTTSSSTTRTTKTTTTTETTWYTQPWVWVVGAAVLILLLVALLRGGSRSGTETSRTDTVKVTRSSSTDSDV